ncbi:unnamed protein product [Linum tenue]|uniref:Uncharacterized protein n=1 Tax=Linum tenue TaxID=586396 RepID=A0AAV0RCJ8_9ROSI|nr:unnamed protein product [Linum tenue]
MVVRSQRQPILVATTRLATTAVTVLDEASPAWNKGVKAELEELSC